MSFTPLQLNWTFSNQFVYSAAPGEEISLTLHGREVQQIPDEYSAVELLVFSTFNESLAQSGRRLKPLRNSQMTYTVGSGPFSVAMKSEQPLVLEVEVVKHPETPFLVEELLKLSNKRFGTYHMPLLIWVDEWCLLPNNPLLGIQGVNTAEDCKSLRRKLVAILSKPESYQESDASWLYPLIELFQSYHFSHKPSASILKVYDLSKQFAPQIKALFESEKFDEEADVLAKKLKWNEDQLDEWKLWQELFPLDPLSEAGERKDYPAMDVLRLFTLDALELLLDIGK